MRFSLGRALSKLLCFPPGGTHSCRKQSAFPKEASPHCLFAECARPDSIFLCDPQGEVQVAAGRLGPSTSEHSMEALPSSNVSVGQTSSHPFPLLRDVEPGLRELEWGAQDHWAR